jgi:hypothetical protein
MEIEENWLRNSRFVNKQMNIRDIEKIKTAMDELGR